MSGESWEIEGEVCRAFAMSGVTFSFERALAPDGREIRLFRVRFEDGAPAFDVCCYVVQPFFISGCTLEMTTDTELDRFNEVLVRSSPMVRAVKNATVPTTGRNLLWVEATSIIHTGRWEGDAFNLAVAPVSIVANAVRMLLARFPAELTIHPGLAVPLVEVQSQPSVAPPPGGAAPVARTA